MRVKCISVHYEEGRRLISQGVKKDESGIEIQGRIFRSVGYGRAHYFVSSKLLLRVEIQGVKELIIVSDFFKESIGKLTLKRVNLIKDTMPDFIEVEKTFEKNICSDSDLTEDHRKTKYKALFGELSEWNARFQKALVPAKKVKELVI